MVKNKTYNSDQERRNDGAIDSEDDAVVIQQLTRELEAKRHAIGELEAEKSTQQERIQQLETNITNISADQQRNLAKLEDDEVVIQRLTRELEAKRHAIGELEAEKRTHQERIQQLETEITNISADQQRNLAQLKESLSFSADNEQQFRW
eukprot:492307_1